MKANKYVDETSLIERLKDSDQAAFNALYHLYAKRLFAFCLEYTKNRDDAEEILQDVFIQLWKHRENITQTASIKSLLFKIAKNQLINAYRSKVNSLLYEDYLLYKDSIEAQSSRDSIEYHEFYQQFQSALSALPKTQQQAIELSRLEDMSIKDIAQALNLSEQTIKNQISLGIKTLTKAIKPSLLIALISFSSYLWDFLFIICVLYYID